MLFRSGTSTATGTVYALNNTYTTATTTASSATTTDVVVSSIATFAAGQPVVFSFNSGNTATNVGLVGYVSCTATTTGTNLITCGSTTGLYQGQAIVFNASVGGLITGTVYYVLSIAGGTTFTVSTIPYGTAVILTSSTTAFTGVPSYYITFVNKIGRAHV